MLGCMNVMAALGELGARDLGRVGYDNPLRLLRARIEPKRLAAAPQVLFDGRCFRVAGSQ
jgi:hypothetical protein